MSAWSKDVAAHLTSQCEVMARLIDAHQPPHMTAHPPEKYFDVLAASIVGQQLSTKAAATIEARLRAALGELTPETVLATDPASLRAVGLSESKSRYLGYLAQAFVSGEIVPQAIQHAPDEEIIETLAQVKGIGRWTAEMFLMFGLARPDVWSMGDLGLRRGLEYFFGSADPELPERWAPYRTYAAWYVWEEVDQGYPSLTTVPRPSR